MTNNFLLILIILFSFIAGAITYHSKFLHPLLRKLKKTLFSKSDEIIQKITVPESDFNKLGFKWKNYHYSYQFQEIEQSFRDKIKERRLEYEKDNHDLKLVNLINNIERKCKTLKNELAIKVDPNSYSYKILSKKTEYENSNYKIQRVSLKSNVNSLTIEMLCGFPKTNVKVSSGILALHGYTSSPEKVMGLGNEDYSKSFGRKLLENGYIVISPFLLNNGDLISSISALGSLVGQNILSLELQKIFTVVNYLSDLKNLNSDKIGIYGISGGANLALFATVLDRRIKCVVSSGIFRNQLNTLIDYSLGKGIYKRSNHHFRSNYYFMPPEFYINFSYTELAKMICPTPLLFENGKKDIYLNDYDDSKEYDKVQQFYKSHNNIDKICLHNHDGAHEVMGEKSFLWLDKWLKA